jgi:pimeloyl-ACP methyl ester carboxylesterase
MARLPPRSYLPGLNEGLECVRGGSGAATVVLVNGAGGPLEGWLRVFGPVAGFAKVFAYNRPGIGASSKPRLAQTASHMVESLRTALQAAALPPPYLLVGHSFGGLIVNLFARRHPGEVAGVVFLDATAPHDVLLLPQHDNAVQRALRRTARWLAPPHRHAESEHAEASAAEILQAPPFPHLPLAVITGGAPALAWATAPALLAARAEHQRQLVALSPFGRQIIAARSGHFPQLSEPALVVEAIRATAMASSVAPPLARSA